MFRRLAAVLGLVAACFAVSSLWISVARAEAPPIAIGAPLPEVPAPPVLPPIPSVSPVVVVPQVDLPAAPPPLSAIVPAEVPNPAALPAPLPSVVPALPAPEAPAPPPIVRAAGPVVTSVAAAVVPAVATVVEPIEPLIRDLVPPILIRDEGAQVPPIQAPPAGGPILPALAVPERFDALSAVTVPVAKSDVDGERAGRAPAESPQARGFALAEEATASALALPGVVGSETGGSAHPTIVQPGSASGWSKAAGALSSPTLPFAWTALLVTLLYLGAAASVRRFALPGGLAPPSPVYAPPVPPA